MQHLISQDETGDETAPDISNILNISFQSFCLVVVSAATLSAAQEKNNPSFSLFDPFQPRNGAQR